jgi:competence protein ComFC
LEEPTAALQWQQFSYRLESGFWKAVDWIFPPECPGCKTMGTRLCTACDQSVAPLPEPFCPVCGEPGTNKNICQDCLSNPPDFDALRSFTLFDGTIREALHRLKYNNDVGLGEVLAPYLVKTFTQQSWNIDMVTAVPLSKKRLRSRGYNQAEKLARPFAALIEKPYYASAIHRKIDTKSQIDLSAEERRENVSDAFYANSMLVDLKSVIIIDDVSTTGSTISECARALKLAGAKEVFALTLARAPLRTSKR